MTGRKKWLEQIIEAEKINNQRRVKANEKWKMHGIKKYCSTFDGTLSFLFNTSALAFVSLFCHCLSSSNSFLYCYLMARLNSLHCVIFFFVHSWGRRSNVRLFDNDLPWPWLKPNNSRWVSVMVTKFRASWQCALFFSHQLCITLLLFIYTCYKYLMSRNIVRKGFHV